MVCELPAAETEALRADVHAFLKMRPDLGPADLAQHTTLAESTVRSFIRGNIPGGIDVCREVRQALAWARAGDILRPGEGRTSVMVAEDATKRVRRVAKTGKFYQTQTVQRVAEVMDFCAEQCAIGVITADFGVGKTEAVNFWRREHHATDCTYFEFDEFSSTNKVDFVRCLARMYGISREVGSQNGGLVFRELVDKLKEQPSLLVFDQCETVRPRVCQVIRQLHDRTKAAGVGVVMLAAPILLARLMGGKMVDLGALTSRVGIWAPLAGITRGEMKAVIKQEGIGEVDEAAFDVWYRATGGSMRRLMRSVDLLKTKHAGKRVSEQTVVQVAGHLWGMAVGQ